MNYGLSTVNLRKLAYEFAKENAISYPDSWDINKIAGEGWLRWFKKRHSDVISLRKPEATSLSRATAFNKHNIEMFFKNLNSLCEKHHFDPSRIFNIDETGVTTVHAPP